MPARIGEEHVNAEQLVRTYYFINHNFLAAKKIVLRSAIAHPRSPPIHCMRDVKPNLAAHAFGEQQPRTTPPTRHGG